MKISREYFKIFSNSFFIKLKIRTGKALLLKNPKSKKPLLLKSKIA